MSQIKSLKICDRFSFRKAEFYNKADDESSNKKHLDYIIFYFHKSFRFFNLKSFSIVSKKEFLEKHILSDSKYDTAFKKNYYYYKY